LYTIVNLQKRLVSTTLSGKNSKIFGENHDESFNKIHFDPREYP